MTESLQPFQEFMTEQGYPVAKLIPGGKYVAIMPLVFTTAIIIGLERDYMIGYEDRWCYHNLPDAVVALSDWEAKGYEGEPDGWHRHPDSGRRRPDGDPSREEIWR